MSKILPAKDSLDWEADNICPRYKQWMRRINNKGPKDSCEDHSDKDKCTSSHSRYKHLFSHRVSKRKRAKSSLSGEPLASKKSHSHTNASVRSRDKPLRSKSIFFRIRQKGRNFGIRCKTSVELWHKWIKRGIRWDRTVSTKEVDIDIINKPENKLKDFSKKSIINEVILEEDELDENESNATRPKLEATAAVVQSELKPSIVINGDKHSDKNFLVDASYIQKASNLFRHSKSKEESKLISSGDTAAKQTNGVAKYPMRDLASMDIGRIEQIGPRDETQRTSNDARLPVARPRAGQGAIHRAFNKLKLLF